jgi:hypothetical protein
LRRYFNVSSTVLSLFTALLAILSVLITQGSAVLHRHSQTEFKVTGALGPQIHLKVWNNGREPAALLSYRLKFDSLPLKTADLTSKDVQNGRNIILPGKPVEVVLESHKLEKMCDSTDTRSCSDATILTQLQRANLTMEIEIEESGHYWNLLSAQPFRHWQPDTFSGSIVSEFLKEACCV